MTDSQLKYVGAPPLLIGGSAKKSLRERIPWMFTLVVALPTLIASIYFFLMASPQYVSEARFIVRNASGGGAPSAFGVALQGVGLSGSQTEAFAVHEYITSGQAVTDLSSKLDLAAVLGPPEADFLSKYPRLGESRSKEGLKKALERYVTVGYDSTTGISTLRVQAFKPKDAQLVAQTLLVGGEKLVNRLNERSRTDTLADARFARDEAQRRLDMVQSQIAAFRNDQQIVDPGRAAIESGQLIGTLMAAAMQLRAERDQLASTAPQSPALPTLDARIAAYDRQIAKQRAEVAGSAASLAPSVGVYEELLRRREFATEELAQMTKIYLTAEQDVRRQNLYLERIVQPSIPQESLEPQRLVAVLSVFGTMVLIYGLSLLLWTGFREHRQA